MQSPIALSASARRAVSQLLGQVEAVLEALPAPDATANLHRYADLLRKGLETGSLEEALRGANLITGVNKGLGDLARIAASPDVTRSVYALSMSAIEVAKVLREARGGPL